MEQVFESGCKLFGADGTERTPPDGVRVCYNGYTALVFTPELATVTDGDTGQVFEVHAVETHDLMVQLMRTIDMRMGFVEHDDEPEAKGPDDDDKDDGSMEAFAAHLRFERDAPLRILTFGNAHGNYRSLCGLCDATFGATIIQSDKRRIKNLHKARGTQDDVIRVVSAAPQFREFVQRLVARVRDGPLRRNTIGIYCTKGHHRSVAIAEWLLRNHVFGLTCPVTVEHKTLHK